MQRIQTRIHLGRGNYEQGPLAVLLDIATVSRCRALCYHSGEDGWMVADGVLNLPRIQSVFTPQDLEPMSSGLLQPQEWYELMGQLFTRCESSPGECIGQRPFLVCLHLFGGLKSREEETIRIIFV